MNPNKSPSGSGDDEPEESPPSYAASRQEFTPPPELPKPFWKKLGPGPKGDFFGNLVSKSVEIEDDDESAMFTSTKKNKSKEKPLSETGSTPKVEELPVSLVESTKSEDPALTSAEEIPVTDIGNEQLVLETTQELSEATSEPISEQPRAELVVETKDPSNDDHVISTSSSSTVPQMKPVYRSISNPATTPSQTHNTPPPFNPNVMPPLPVNPNVVPPIPANPNIQNPGGGQQGGGNVLQNNLGSSGNPNYNQASSKPQVINERRIERKISGALSAVLLADGLSRRRDKKLAEQIKKTAKAQEQKRAELEAHQQAQINELNLRRDQDSREAKRNMILQNQKIENMAKLEHPVEVPESSPVIIPATKAEFVKSPTYVNQVLETKEENVQNNILNSVAEINQQGQTTIEQNIVGAKNELQGVAPGEAPASSAAEILEKKYNFANDRHSTEKLPDQTRPEKVLSTPEFSREVDPFMRRQSQVGQQEQRSSADSHGTIPPVAQSSSVFSTNQDSQSSQTPTPQPKKDDDSYKQAVTYGIAAAIFILVFAFISVWVMG